MICRFFTFSTNCGFFVAATATISSKSCKTSISSQTHPSNMNTKKGKISSTTSHSQKNETDTETERENTLMNTKYNRNYISKRSSKKTSMDCWGRNFVGEICICFCTRTLRWTQLTHRLINQNKDQLGGLHVSSLVEYCMVLLRYIMNPHDVNHDIDISYHNILSDIIAIFRNLKSPTATCQKNVDLCTTHPPNHVNPGDLMFENPHQPPSN